MAFGAVLGQTQSLDDKLGGYVIKDGEIYSQGEKINSFPEGVSVNVNEACPISIDKIFLPGSGTETAACLYSISDNVMTKIGYDTNNLNGKICINDAGTKGYGVSFGSGEQINFIRYDFTTNKSNQYNLTTSSRYTPKVPLWAGSGTQIAVFYSTEPFTFWRISNIDSTPSLRNSNGVVQFTLSSINISGVIYHNTYCYCFGNYSSSYDMWAVEKFYFGGSSNSPDASRVAEFRGESSYRHLSSPYEQLDKKFYFVNVNTQEIFYFDVTTEQTVTVGNVYSLLGREYNITDMTRKYFVARDKNNYGYYKFIDRKTLKLIGEGYLSGNYGDNIFGEAKEVAIVQNNGVYDLKKETMPIIVKQ